MPIEVSVDGRIERLEMAHGKGSLPVSRQAHVVIDPYRRVLKRSIAIEQYQAWLAAREQNSKK